MSKVRKFIRDNQLAVLLFLIAYHVLIAFASYQVFTNMADVTASIATCFTVLLGLPASTGLLVMWTKKDEPNV